MGVAWGTGAEALQRYSPVSVVMLARNPDGLSGAGKMEAKSHYGVRVGSSSQGEPPQRVLRSPVSPT